MDSRSSVSNIHLNQVVFLGIRHLAQSTQKEGALDKKEGEAENKNV